MVWKAFLHLPAESIRSNIYTTSKKGNTDGGTILCDLGNVERKSAAPLQTAAHGEIRVSRRSDFRAKSYKLFAPDDDIPLCQACKASACLTVVRVLVQVVLFIRIFLAEGN